VEEDIVRTIPEIIKENGHETVAEAARALGLLQQTVYNHVWGKHQMRASDAVRYMRIFGATLDEIEHHCKKVEKSKRGR
jgi:plasmid maintenance system antidote protein VapI